ncbi:hypothetical protein FOZ62_015977, partial [Perkinsus olseni]
PSASSDVRDVDLLCKRVAVDISNSQMGPRSEPELARATNILRVTRNFILSSEHFPMSHLFGVILLLALNALLQAQPSGKYCGSPSSPAGNSTVYVTMTSQTTFDITVGFSPTGGQDVASTKTGVTYEYDSSTGRITVTDVNQLLILISDIGAPFDRSELSNTTFWNGAIYVNLNAIQL